MTTVRIIQWSALEPEQQRQTLERPALSSDAQFRARVAALIERVRVEGDAALLALPKEIGAPQPRSIAVDRQTLKAAGEQLTRAQRQAIEAAAANIEEFHAAQMPVDIEVDTAEGVRCERVTRPIARVGLYVPAGTAPLPSTALMLGIPARIAGCRLRVLCSPARKDGNVDPAVLYAAGLCDIENVYAIGGAQAVAAMAYGTQTVPRVDKIFGPGSAWVTEAKAQVSADPNGAAQDLPAGPSEVLVVADADARPEFVAADLLSQAEHGADSQAVLVTDSQALARAVAAAVETQLSALSREALTRQALEHSVAIVTEDLQSAFDVANRYAPEHLIVQVADPRRWLAVVENAGSVFLGPWAPESVGDYCSGTNHVLPTYGYARSYSSLGLSDFMRAMTVQELQPRGIREIGPVAIELSQLEGLDAHANAVSIRLAALEE